MGKFMRTFKRDILLLSLAYLLLGALLLLFPERSGLMICYLCGGILCIYGIFHVVVYVSRELLLDDYSLDLATGIIGLAVGIFLFVKPTVLLNVLPTVLGVVVALDAVIKIQNSVDLLRFKYRLWYTVLLAAVIGGVLGILMLTDPFSSKEDLLLFTGGGLIVSALCDLWTLFCLQRKLRSAPEETVSAPAQASLSESEKSVTQTEESVPVSADMPAPDPTLPAEDAQAKESFEVDF